MSTHDTLLELGLVPGASSKEIKAAYRKRAMKLHPDVIGGDGSQFKALTERVDALLYGGLRYQYVYEKGEDPRKYQRWRQQWEHHYSRHRTANKTKASKDWDLRMQRFNYYNLRFRVFAGLLLCSMAIADEMGYRPGGGRKSRCCPLSLSLSVCLQLTRKSRGGIASVTERTPHIVYVKSGGGSG